MLFVCIHVCLHDEQTLAISDSDRSRTVIESE